MKRLFKAAAFMLAFVPLSAKADLFSITLTQNGQTTTKGFTSVMDIFDQYEDGTLDTILAGYNTSDPAEGVCVGFPRHSHGVELYERRKFGQTACF